MDARRDPGSAWDVAAVLCYAGLTLLQFAPLLTHLADALPSDPGDPLLNTWILWWNAHEAPWSSAYWHAPAFAPAPYALSLSETLLGLTVLTTPPQWLGATPIQAYNVLFLLTPALNGCAAYALGRMLTGRRDAAFVGGLYFMMAPYRASQLPHVQTLATFYMPLALLAVHGYWRTGRARWLTMLAAATALNGLVSGYHLVYFALPLGLALLWSIAARRWRDLAALGMAMAAALAGLLPILLPYRHAHDLWNLRRGIGEMYDFSADLTSFVASAPALIVHAFPTLFPKPEADVYPGLVGLTLFVAICVAAATSLDQPGDRARVSWSVWVRRALLVVATVAGTAGLATAILGPVNVNLGVTTLSMTSINKPIGLALNALVVWAALSPRLWSAAARGSDFALYGAMLVAATILMLGPEGHVMGERFWYKAPAAWLLPLPGFDTVRVPARWASIQVLAVSALLALMLARARDRVGPRAAIAVAAVCSGLIVIEGWIRLPVAAVPEALPLVPRAELVVELPTRGWAEDVAAMFRGTVHGRRVVNGYSGHEPPHYAALTADLQANCLESLDALRRGRSLDVVIHTTDRDGPPVLDAVTRRWPTAPRDQAGAVVIVHVAGDRDRAIPAYDDPIDLGGFCGAARSTQAAPP